MIKAYQGYLIKIFYKKILNISLIFLCLIIVLNIFEEISFFKNMDVNFFFPFLISLLKTPSNLFEIFPFIFLIASQFFFLELITKNELETLKIHGLNNFKLIKILFFSSLFLGIILTGVFYNISAKLNFLYLEIKNTYSDDNKYLLVVTKNGLWIKDEIDEKTYIINATEIEENFLKNVVISTFDNNFNLESVIKTLKIDITSFDWDVYLPIIAVDNKTKKLKENISIKTHFDQKKINSLYKSLASLTMFDLLNLKKEYELIGYSTSEIESKLHKLLSFPVYLTILTLLTSVIMLNIKRDKPFIFHVILGIFLSVIIYYFYFLFNLLGKNNTIPILISIWLPLLILIIIVIIGLVKIDEK